MGIRIAAVAFVGSEATMVYNTRKVDPADVERTIASQSRREYKGTNDAASVAAFARSVVGKSADGAVAHMVAPGIYSVELPDAEKPAKGK